MFDFGLSYAHMLLLGLLAFLVIGKEDMPVVLRKFGQFMAKVRAMSREFQSHVDVAMKDAGVADLKGQLQGLKSGIDSGVAMPAMQVGQVSAPSPMAVVRKADFEKLFGAEAQSGETVVGGKLVEPEQAAKA